MDIDSPPAALPDPPTSHTHLINLPSFSSSFPLPFRVLFLVGLAQLLWASNLHILHLLGLDTSWILDFRDTDEDTEIELDSLRPTRGEDEMVDGMAQESVQEDGDQQGSSSKGKIVRPDSGRLYQPVYKLFLLYTAWVGAGWLLFRGITGGDRDSMERWRGLVGVIALGAAVGAVAPWTGSGQRERGALRRAIRRIVLPPLNSPIYFSDVILADILTSFAKVLGDLWISACQIWYGGITQGRVAQTGFANYLTLVMVCFPYMMRFRQCLLEAYQSSWSNGRPIANALKYLSAFPVIMLSAAQKSVVLDIAAQKGMSVQQLKDSGDRWFGEHPMFRMWLLAVVVNSIYSFWWDIQMDWGLSLCEAETWLGKSNEHSGSGLLGSPFLGGGGRRRSSSIGSDSFVGRIRRFLTSRRSTGLASHQRSPCPTPAPSFQSGSFSGSHSGSPLSSPSSSAIGTLKRFGLRQHLLLPDPSVYHMFALIDLVLRFTWSLKLSSHLHTISEIESGVFMMEALELVRRWMWVFVRVEWEAVKLSENKNWKTIKNPVEREGSRLFGERGSGTVIWEEEKDER